MLKAVPDAPKAARHCFTTTHHGVTRNDPYAWLRADNWQEVMREPDKLPEDIRAYLEAENSYFERSFAPLEPLKEQLFEEYIGRIKEDDRTVPSKHGPYAYFTRVAKGKQYAIHLRTPREGGDEEVLFDGNKESDGGYFNIGQVSHDPTHTKMLWSVDKEGSEYFTIRLRDIATGKDLDDVLTHTTGGGVFTPDGAFLFYTKLDKNHRPYQIYRHQLGTRQSDDILIYEEKDPGFFIGVSKTKSGKYIIIDAHNHTTSEAYLIDTDDISADPKCIHPRTRDLQYSVTERHGTLFIHTNADAAIDFKVMTVDANAPTKDNWVDLIPHQSGTLILTMSVIENHFIRLERENGLPRLIVRDLRTGKESPITFDEEAYSLGFSSGLEFDTATIRLTYASPTTPAQTYDLDLNSGERILLREQEVPCGHDPKNYVTKRIFANADDGAEVPVTLLYHKDTLLDGTAPCHLYGYGAYGHAMSAGFSITALSLAERGFICATAHIRGGMDKGYQWYLDGKLDKKINSFKDFICVADKLIEDQYTAKGKIVAEGGSAGGLLMGAVANLAPDRFGGIAAHVPFVDVLNTMLDETLPLTPPEWPEWGNPIEDIRAYQTIAAYAPYEQVRRQAYPPMFVTAGVSDPRVTYWEPAKWIAKLRHTKTNNAPIWLKTNMSAGHSGVTGRYDSLKEHAEVAAFIIAAVSSKKQSAVCSARG